MTKGVLIVNLGTPKSPHPKDVKEYLHEFLLDKKVIGLPWLARQLLVRGMIVPKRHKESAHAYSQIWQKEGSPLLIYAKQLQQYLQSNLNEIEVALGMRYQSPSIGEALEELVKKNVKELLVLPLFPQYATATTGSIFEKTINELKKKKYTPKISFIQSFASESFFIESICNVAQKYDIPSYDHVLFSFHGLPQKQLKEIYPDYCCKEGNSCCKKIGKDNEHCYAAQCYLTAQMIISKLDLKVAHDVCFQSRLGKDPWLSPYTVDRIRSLALNGKKRVLVFCPSFVCDCLETTYEIGIEYGKLFRENGGETLDFVEGLNNNPFWYEGIKNMIIQNLK